ncbi:MAG TPA: OB-fold domain-containing protein [Sporichthya sp.]|nr:OB-fold domain-containing protein [Sporichthya sp.]
MPQGIVAYAAYLPAHRLALADVAATLGAGRGKGTRVVASFDEDSTTMAVEAGRAALRRTAVRATSLWFATTSPAYAEKTNASAIHAALGLGSEGFAVDLAGSARSAQGALRAAATQPGGLALLADVRVGTPGSAEERENADGAAAFLFGPEDEAIAVEIATASVTGEFLDRWRAPGEHSAKVWEERFGQEMYTPLIAAATSQALAAANLTSVDHVVVSCPHSRTAAATRAAHENSGADLTLGQAGAADLGLRLADALDRAGPGQTILVISAADGADATVWRVTDRIPAARAAGRVPPVREQLAGGREVGYGTYLTWRGLLEREGPRRPDPERPAGPPSARALGWKFAFVGSRCDKCGFLHLPPARVCVSCRVADQMTPAGLADATGTVVTFTVDRLAYSPSPPVIDAVVDFDGGGRTLLELADAKPEDIAVGSRVALTFRRLYTSGGVHNYFWKARILKEVLSHGE